MKFPPESTRKIAIFRALQLGDMLCAVPALRALRAAYPNAEMTLLGLPWAASFCKRFDQYVDRFVHFPGHPGLPEQPFDQTRWADFEEIMQNEQFDLILQMQGSGGIVNDMLENLNAGPVAGFHSQGSYREKDIFIEYPTGISEMERHLMMLENLGIPSLSTDLEFPVSIQEIEDLHQIDFLPEPRTYVCVHPGSRGSWRQWPPSHFACLADQCAGMGYQVILTGTNDEASITGQVIDLMDYPALDFTGKTGLGQIAQLIGEAQLLISNCTGVSHIASALKTPSIVISMDGEPERWGPLDKDLHKTFDWTRIQNFEEILTQTGQLLVRSAKPAMSIW
jgi:ADP-heptose:LPS heptosyltransferase